MTLSIVKAANVEALLYGRQSRVILKLVESIVRSSEQE